MATLEATFDELASYIAKHGNPRGRPKEEVRVSRFDALETMLVEAERLSGFMLPPDLRALYRRCDGFTDTRYTSLHSLEHVIEQLRGFDRKQAGLKTISIGDGCGLDEKSIVLMNAEHFRDNEARIVFYDYRLDFDEELNASFKSRLTSEAVALWKAGSFEVTEEMVTFGPANAVEFLEYVVSTAEQV
ncbi:MAG: hypothetical protein ACKV2T_40200 [Kofleriaceae bacterium]